MRRNGWRAGIVVLAIAIALPFGFGALRAWANYVAGPPITMDTTIYHSCQCSLPTPTDRTEIGIGEAVNLWISTQSFSDLDYDTNACTGLFTTVSDSIGDKIWTASKEFDIVNAQSASTGNSASVTLEAARLTTSGNGTVSWLVHDSGNKGHDSPINLGSISFAIQCPSSLTTISKEELTIGQEDPNGDMMGEDCSFYVQILPVTVNFENVQMTEYCPTFLYTWPNGLAKYYPRSVESQYPETTIPPNSSPQDTRVNIVSDELALTAPTTYLDNGSGGSNANVSALQYIGFVNLYGIFSPFYSHMNVWQYRASDFRAHSEWDNLVESWRGPFASGD